MGEPLSPDHVFDFPMDEPEPHPAYDFFTPRPLLWYACNLNNNNGWIETDLPLLRELGTMADEPMVGLLVDEITEPIVEAKEPVITPVTDMEEDIDMLFVDGDFGDDDSEGFKDEEEFWELNEEWLIAPVTPPLIPADLSTRMSNLKYEHGQLVKKVIQVSDVEVADGITIGEIGPTVSAIEGQVQVMASQMVQAVDRLTQVGAQVE
nr:hypothetical protein [Tanacetum cinerariifolium]